MAEFRKRKVKPRGALRKTRAVEDDAESEINVSDDEASDQLKLLAELREEQKDRRRAPGLSSHKLLAISEEGLRKREKKREEEEKGLQDEAAGPDLKALMTSQFTGQVGQGQDGGKAHEQRMEDFIEEQVNEKMGIKKDKDTTATEDPRTMTEEDKLYLIPDEFKSKPRDLGDDGSFNKREGFSGEAAPLFMNTGIAEVSLPLDFRLRNIEKTDEARKLLIGSNGRFKDRAAGNHKPAVGKGSITANYNQHQRDWAEMMDKKRRANEAGATTGLNDGQNDRRPRNFHRVTGRSSATDDAVYERYKKRSRR